MSIKLKLKPKLLISFILLSTIPLIMVNLLWFGSSRNQVVSTTSDQLSSTASDFAHQIDSYLELKEIGLIIHSQTDSILSNDITKSTSELKNLLLQDKDIDEISMLDFGGKELVHMTRDRVFGEGELIDQSSSLAFKIPTYVGGDRYISPLFINSSGEPSIYIAIPIVKPDSAQELQQLTTSSSGKSRKPGEIHGVLIVSIDLSSFLKQITSYKIGEHGYIFLVDEKGNAIAHRDPALSRKLVNLKSNPVVNSYVNSLVDGSTGKTVFQEVNEYGVPSLVSYKKATLTSWGVIAQVPMSDILGNTYRIIGFVLLIMFSLLLFVFLSSVWLSRKIVQPIYELQKGSKLIGTGNLDHQITVRTGDEIEELGNEFNSMTKNLKYAFKNLEQDKNIISTERNKLSMALSNIEDAVILVDINKNVVVFNRAAEMITGYAADRVLGKKIYDFIQIFSNNISVPHTVYCPVQQGDAKVQPYSKQEVVLKVGLKETPIDIRSNPIVYGQNLSIGCIITLHDLTKAKELERMKLDFVSMAAHELRTPITAIRGYLSVYLTENQKFMNDDQKMLTHNIQLATERLAALVENLLSVSRMEKGTFSMTLKMYEWETIVKEVVNELVVRATEKQIKLSIIPSPSPLPNLYIDKLRMTEVLSNLILNAINYTDQGGSITISTELNGAEVITHIKDTGKGIAKDAIPHLFTKFFRVSGTLEGVKGTGLGLYLSKAIVEKHKGRIWVESEIGKGSTFSFSLPVHAALPAAEDKHTSITV